MSSSSNPHFDVVVATGDSRIPWHNIGRAWVNARDGRRSVRIQLDSVPVAGQAVKLFGQDDEPCDFPELCDLSVRIERGQDGFWARLGSAFYNPPTDTTKESFNLIFRSLPLGPVVYIFPRRQADEAADAE